ncbi:unnamed protein product [Auanema sp. JU1783]|nr:unnamed protein product [Auanema sp. JU1783]
MGGLIDNFRSYPTTVFLMLGNEFCERFSFYGMKAILTLYFIIEHHYSPSTATLIYHGFTCLAYTSPLIGSLLADSYLGRFKVILYGSMIYVLGHILLSFGAIPTFEYTTRTFFDFSGLIVIAFATGGIKPCVSAFAADQFSEHQEDLRAQFFSFFYFAINGGSFFAIILTPILRGRVSCLGSEYCFPLAFGVPGVLMLIALLLFLSGWKKFKKYPPSRENILFAVISCIGTAAYRTTSEKSSKPVAHWLDRAAPNYTPEMIKAVRGFVNVAVIFSPLVVFWALFDQQGSTWVLQARRLDGRIGWLTVLPEQVNTLNPLIVLIMVPIFEGIVYPTVKKFTKVTPLRKMAIGGLLTALAFVMAGFLQLEVNNTMEEPPTNGNIYVQRIGNSSNLGTLSSVNGELVNAGILPSGRTEMLNGMYSINVLNDQHYLNLTESGMGYVVGLFDGTDGKSRLDMFKYSTEKADNGASRIYLIVPSMTNGTFFVVDSNEHIVSQTPLRSGEKVDIRPPIIGKPEYMLYFGENCSGTDCPRSQPFTIQMGSVHVLHIHDHTDESDFHQLVRPNTVSILWMIPQYVVITLGEILLSVTGLEFAYSQSSPNMKSVLQALWLLTVFMGNVIDMAISGTHIIPEPAAEFFVYAVLMVLVMGVFILLAMRYEYVDEEEAKDKAIETKERLPTESSTY